MTNIQTPGKSLFQCLCNLIGYKFSTNKNLFFKWGFISKERFGFGLVLSQLLCEVMEDKYLVTRKNIYLSLFLFGYSIHFRIPKEFESKERITVFLSCVYIFSIKKLEFICNNQFKTINLPWG